MGIDEKFEAKLGEGAITVRGVFMGIAPTNGDTLKAAHGSSLHCDLSSNWYIQVLQRCVCSNVCTFELRLAK